MERVASALRREGLGVLATRLGGRLRLGGRSLLATRGLGGGHRVDRRPTLTDLLHRAVALEGVQGVVELRPCVGAADELEELRAGDVLARALELLHDLGLEGGDLLGGLARVARRGVGRALRAGDRGDRALDAGSGDDTTHEALHLGGGGLLDGLLEGLSGLGDGGGESGRRRTSHGEPCLS